ncbi:MAG TPA: serine/threonine-protein kinase [Verrucomicrobiota bacterium]|nr:serine/threonine-protein kinase [Verrucomicrobiota bacterium]HNU52005.1 serine/threonine-protein kinase [Verrucomicrobiota bacterium]
MADLPPSTAPPVIPDHELLERIGQGSYGEVWLARSAMGTLRAAKIIRRASFADPRPYEREFSGLKHFEPISRKHEGLVDILQVGRNDDAGYFYYVMELADNANTGPPEVPAPAADPPGSPASTATSDPGGRSATPAPDGYKPLTLESRIRGHGRLPVPECVAIGASLADALRFLHDQGLVHRDIKPSNIIFVGGVPKLADVGLVARSDDARSFVGTEGFIPPEGPGSVRADIYGLGKCLYEMAMGKDRMAFPSPPSHLDDLPQRSELIELNEIITRACEPDPARRYPDAQAMLSDLELLRQGDSVRRARTRSRRWRVAARFALFALLCGAAILVAKSVGPKPERILFAEEFDAHELDTNHWDSNHFSRGTDPAKGNRVHDVRTVGGALVLNARVEHDEGLACSEAVWVDLRHDFRPLGPCRLQVTLSGESYGGAIGAVVSAGGDPIHIQELTGGRLVDDYDALMWHTNQIAPATVRADFLPAVNAAVIWPNADRLDQFEVLDLSSLPQWHLRFLCGAQTSQGFGTSRGELRIERVTISALDSPYALVGRVIEDVSEWPVKDALIRDASGISLATTASSGAFCLTQSPRGPLTIEKADFATVRLETGLARRQPLLARLPKTVFGPGDVVARILYRDMDIKDISFRQETLWALASDGFDDNRFLPIDPVRPSSAWLTHSVPINTRLQAFAQCGDRLLGLTHWPGCLHDVTARPDRLLLKLEPPNTSRPIDWPNDCVYDGQYLWFTEVDISNARWCLHALDIQTLRVPRSLESRDPEIRALAWDGNWFWISSRTKGLYAIDRDVALRKGTVEAGMARGPYPGHYIRLAFGGGTLWGLDHKRRCLCKIQTDDPRATATRDSKELGPVYDRAVYSKAVGSHANAVLSE